ncbi:hypothetical protein NVP1184A_21 [Vibrio phage 1.184.A._10N.286.49.A5]|nr:hypothetical protein NVP1184A_21 [Vibrio phage 1.184.A._10N.286.49.A5]
MQYTKTVTLEINGTEVEAMLTFDYTPEVQGVYDALPQDCFPTEPEEWELIKLVAEDNNCSWMLEHIGDNLIDQIGEENED